ncbi:hypothetical protein BS78_01G139700 [Paspalum vaginatum]|nr:hypothetical protein BS78_01G139700 [Paspalum vaginatum]
MSNEEPAQNNDVSDMSSMLTSRFIWAMQPTRSLLRWSADLHMIFVKAVAYQGGPHEAKPAAIRQTMEDMGVRGLTIHKVKSHLQKYREKCVLGAESPDDTPHTTPPSKAAPNLASGMMMDTDAVTPGMEMLNSFLMADTEMVDNNLSVDQVQMMEKELMDEIQSIEQYSVCSQTAIDEYMDGLGDCAFGHLDFPDFNL